MDGTRYSVVARVLRAKATDGEAKTIEYLTTNPADFGYPTDPVSLIITNKDGTRFHIADKANQREREMKFQQMVLCAKRNQSIPEFENALRWGRQHSAFKTCNEKHWRKEIGGAGGGSSGGKRKRKRQCK